MPGKSYSFRLIINGPDDYSVTYEIQIGITTIGRSPDSLIQLDNHTISRHHARLECIAGECDIIDLDSSNGTYINEAKIAAKTPTRLNDQDQIRLGPYYQMVFLQTETGEEELIPEKVDFLLVNETPESPGIAYFEKIPPNPPAASVPPLPFPDGAEKFTLPELPVNHPFLMKYLPGIYHTDFMIRFLGIFESILMPIKWTIDNFDQFLSPRTTPSAFLPWLANWYEAEFDSTWNETQQRQFLEEAWLLYARRGTKWGLSRILEIYTGQPPNIDDQGEGLRPNSFRVTIPMSEGNTHRASIESLINYYKPAHTDYELYFQE